MAHTLRRSGARDIVGHTCVTHNQHCYHRTYTIERGQGSLWNWVRETGDYNTRPEQEREKERGEESRAKRRERINKNRRGGEKEEEEVNDGEKEIGKWWT